MEATKRNINLDIIRCIAVLSVLSVHFFLNSGYYNEIIIGEKMYVATIVRQGLMICVPLFMMLTGYLMNKKRLTIGYFKGIKKVGVLYILCTICILLYKIFFLKETITILGAVFNITSFQQYSWYVEMYIGFYFLIPFLNILYHNLGSKKEKGILLWVLFFITALPSMINTMIPIENAILMPDYWVELYPFFYYYLGTYLSEYGSEIKLSMPINLALIIITMVASGSYTFWKSYNTLFVHGSWCDYGAFLNVILTVLVFVFVLRMNINYLPKWLERSIQKISEVSLSIYLLSWIFDNYAYSILKGKIENVRGRFVYIFIMVLFVFGCSFVLACLIHYIYKIMFGRKKQHIDENNK